MPRMRTITEAAAYFKDTDPGTALTKTAIRRLVVSGELPSIRVGQKYLVALEALEDFMCGGAKPLRAGIIRPVDGRRAG